MASRSGVPLSQLARPSAPDEDGAAAGEIVRDEEMDAPVALPGGEERAVATGTAPETPFVMIVAVAAGAAALVVVALVAVIVALWAV